MDWEDARKLALRQVVLSRTLVGLVALSALTGYAAGASSAKPLRVLFVGNSYTYGNNLPQLVERIAEATPGRKIEAERVTEPGRSLQWHWLQDGRAVQAIRRGGWDYVVLQDHSMRPIEDRSQFERFSRLFAYEARKVKAKPIFFMTWARRTNPDSQAALTRAYRKLGDQLRTEVAPVGDAWARFIMDNPGERLHVGDDSHANVNGSYLAALVFLGVLRGEVPDEPPAFIQNVPHYDPNKPPTDVSVDPELVERLVDSAREAVQGESSRVQAKQIRFR